MVYKLGNYILRANSSAFTKGFFAKYKQGITNLLVGEKTEGAAVLAAAQMNFYSLPIPADIFAGFTPQRHAELIKKCLERTQGNQIIIPTPEYKSIGQFQGHYNEYRGMRPPGVAKDPNTPINKPLEWEREFHFGKIDPREIFWSGYEMSGIKCDLIYNQFPYAPFHFMLVPERGGKFNQYLDPDAEFDFLKFAWDFIQETGDPNIRVAYNSMGAHASMNHLHFHCFYLTEETKQWGPPPIEKEIDQVMESGHDIGRLENWPIASALVFKSSHQNILKDIYSILDEIHQLDKKEPNQYAYNLYLRPDCLVFIPRKHQATYLGYIKTAAKFTTGPAWLEVLGTIIIPSREEYDSVTEKRIRELYQKISLETPLFE